MLLCPIGKSLHLKEVYFEHIEDTVGAVTRSTASNHGLYNLNDTCSNSHSHHLYCYNLTHPSSDTQTHHPGNTFAYAGPYPNGQEPVAM